MKFVRFILGATICLFALYGGYELYVQKFVNNEISGDVIQELQEAGFDVSSGDANNGLSTIFQSDIGGTPTASFGMGASNPPPSSGSPPSRMSSGGLPPSLRQSETPVTVVAPEPPFQQNPSSVFPFTSPPIPQTPPQSQPIIPDQTSDPVVPSPHSSEAFQQALDAPLFLNSGSTTFLTPPPTLEKTGETIPTGRTTLEKQANVENSLSSFGFPLSSTTQLPTQAPPTPSAQEQITEQPPKQTFAQWPSAYTFGVAAPPAVDIKTTEEPALVYPQIIQPPHVPAEQQLPQQQLANACVPEIATLPLAVPASHPQVQPLPPVENDTSTAVPPVNPPVVIPHLQVISLPPVEDEVSALETQWAMTPALPNPPQIGLPEPPQVETPQATGQPPQYFDTDHGTLQSQVILPVQISPSDQLFVRQDNHPQIQQLPQAPSTTATQSTPATQPDVQQAALAQAPARPQQIAQVNNVSPLPQSQESGVDPGVAAKVAKIGELLTQNQVNDAYEQLSRMYFYDEMTTEERQYVAKHLDLLAGGVLFSPRYHILEQPYVVKEGDTIESIATQYKITPELLRKLNRIPSDTHAAAGTQLKVLRGPLDARIYPEYHELIVMMRDKYACRFPISVGASYAGQTGSFTVQEKALNRGYQLAPGMEVIPAGDPNNPLGTQWIELSKEQGTIGIHGTNRPEQIGTTKRSAGFFGLRDQDITEVYDMLTVGSNVTIVR